MAKREKILCAAIWYDDGKQHTHTPLNIKTGFVICGWRHHNCIGLAHDFGIKSYAQGNIKEVVQGFLTSKGRFLNRRESCQLAAKARQVNICRGKDDILISEDLY